MPFEKSNEGRVDVGTAFAVSLAVEEGCRLNTSDTLFVNLNEGREDAETAFAMSRAVAEGSTLNTSVDVTTGKESRVGRFFVYSPWADTDFGFGSKSRLLTPLKTGLSPSRPVVNEDPGLGK